MDVSVLPCVDALRCPSSRQRLTLHPLREAESLLGGPLVPVRAVRSGFPHPVGPTAQVLVRADRRRAYPMVDDVPILLAPEALGLAADVTEIDLMDLRYAEAYQEMPHYNGIATREAERLAQTADEKALRALTAFRQQFPAPRRVWIDFHYDGHEQWDAYRHLTPIAAARVLQLGGKGAHAVKFLLAGAQEAWNLSPMIGEARYARALARAAGVEQGLRCVVAVAEELPFADAYFDAMFSGSCLHHMITEQAAPEFARTLKPGGRFAAVEPWRAPFYGIGTRLFGKHEANPYCKPLTQRKVDPLYATFPNTRVIHHGAFTRYILVALGKLGLKLSANAAWTIVRIDDAIASLIPGMRRLGSGVAVLATR